MLVRQLGRSDATTQSKSAIAQQEEILDRMDAIKDKKQAIATKRDELLAKRDSIMQGANDQHQHDTQNDVESLMEDLEQAQIASPPPHHYHHHQCRAPSHSKFAWHWINRSKLQITLRG